MQLKPIDSVSGLSGTSFKSDYYHKRKPVVFSNFLEDSPALSKWSYTYLQEKAGNIQVNLYGKEDAFNDHVTSPPVAKSTFGEYLQLIKTNPTDLRLFLFNLLKRVPELQKDIVVNDITGGRVLQWLPYLFFGGAGSSVRYHYDIDMSHVFLTQLEGVKKVWLFPLEQSVFLYKLPFNFHGLANLKNPDYQKYPGLKYINGWETDLTRGETLFIPSGYWHYIQYTTGGYSVSYRAPSDSNLQKITGLRNIFITRKFDNAMRFVFGQQWLDYKIRIADKRAQHAIAKLENIKNPVTVTSV